MLSRLYYAIAKTIHTRFDSLLCRALRRILSLIYLPEYWYLSMGNFRTEPISRLISKILTLFHLDWTKNSLRSLNPILGTLSCISNHVCCVFV